MVQTDPMIAENSTVDEPIALIKPKIPITPNLIVKVHIDDKKPLL